MRKAIACALLALSLMGTGPAMAQETTSWNFQGSAIMGVHFQPSKEVPIRIDVDHMVQAKGLTSSFLYARYLLPLWETGVTFKPAVGVVSGLNGDPFGMILSGNLSGQHGIFGWYAQADYYVQEHPTWFNVDGFYIRTLDLGPVGVNLGGIGYFYQGGYDVGPELTFHIDRYDLGVEYLFGNSGHGPRFLLQAYF